MTTKILSDRQLVSLAPLLSGESYCLRECLNPYSWSNKNYKYTLHQSRNLVLFGKNYASSRIVKTAITKLMAQKFLETCDETVWEDQKLKVDGFRKMYIVPTKLGLEYWDESQSRYDEIHKVQEKRQKKLGVGKMTLIEASGYINDVYLARVANAMIAEIVHADPKGGLWAIQEFEYLDPNMTGKDGSINEGIRWIEPSFGIKPIVNIISDEDISVARDKIIMENRIRADLALINILMENAKNAHFLRIQRDLEADRRIIDSKLEDIRNRETNYRRNYGYSNFSDVI